MYIIWNNGNYYETARKIMNPRVFITNPRLTITDPFEKNSTPKAKRSQAQHKLHVHL